jgi:2-polyprenyl-3-methyl-5-hydroxy-6-metoxy-1,4-benzoquinol methylase
VHPWLRYFAFLVEIFARFPNLSRSLVFRFTPYLLLCVVCSLTVLCLLCQPGGCLFVSTINRTGKSYALAVLGAEYIMRLVPIGTHSWDKFVTPEELESYLASVQRISASNAAQQTLQHSTADASINRDAAAAQKPGNSDDLNSFAPIARLHDCSGMVYNPITREWRLSSDTDVNYIAYVTIA